MGNQLNKGEGERQIRLEVEKLESSLHSAGDDTDGVEECEGRDGEKDGSVEFHDPVKTNVGTGLAKGLANRLSMQCEPRR